MLLSTGKGPLSLLLRALGPSLTAAGLHGALADPKLELFNTNGQLLFINDDWKDTQESEIEATGLAPIDDSESAAVVTLSPGAYTSIVAGVAEARVLVFCNGIPSTRPSASSIPRRRFGLHGKAFLPRHWSQPAAFVR